MNNNEFASLLLTEAAELLNEASRYDKELSKQAGRKSKKEAGEIVKDNLNKVDRLYAGYDDISNKSPYVKEKFAEAIDAGMDAVEDAKEYGRTMKKIQNAHLDSMKKEGSDLDKRLTKIADVEEVKRREERAKRRKEAKKKAEAQTESIAILLSEATDLLNEPNYNIKKGNSLYDGTKFIGSFDNDKEKEELMKEYEEELKKKK